MANNAFSDNDPTVDLNSWFSGARMSRYAFHPAVEDLYVWNTRLSKALLEDIQHVEVLLRNRVDSALSPDYGSHWFNNTQIPFDHLARKSIGKAQRRAGGTDAVPTPSGKIIAELSFDFWFFLLSSRYQTTVWPKLQATLIGSPPPSLAAFRGEVELIYRLRNRCAHHEPLVQASRPAEDSYLDRRQLALDRTARWISPAAADWILSHSRIAGLRELRPVNS